MALSTTRDVRHDDAARGAVEHWNLPDSQHTRAIRQHATEYERRVVGHFDAALLSGVQPTPR